MDPQAEDVVRKKFWRHIPCPTILFVLSSVGVASAQPYPEIVIPVSDSEARSILESDRHSEMHFEKLSWLSKGRIRVVKINGDVLSLVGEKVQFTAFEHADPIIVVSNGIEGDQWTGARITGRYNLEDHGGMERRILESPEHDPDKVRRQVTAQVWRENNVSFQVYLIPDDSDPSWNLGDSESVQQHQEAPIAPLVYSLHGEISTDGMGHLSKGKPLNGHRYGVTRVQIDPAYVIIYEAARKWPNIPIDDYRSQAQREADEKSPRMVAHRKTEAYRLEQQNKESYDDHVAAAEARIRARGSNADGVSQ